MARGVVNTFALAACLYSGVWRLASAAPAVGGSRAASAPIAAPANRAAANAQLRAAQGASCAVTDVHMVGPAGAPDWSRANGLVAYFFQDSAGFFQVYRMLPDGSQNQCLTCAGLPGAPAARLHKGSPSWDPSGHYILFQAEIPDHPGREGDADATPGAGFWQDLWLMTADGKQFWQLTDYGTTNLSGVLVPRFSRDGSKVFWAQLLAGRVSSTYRTGPFGRWRLDVADFVIQNNTPQILNTRLYAPANGIFYESQDWAPDGTKVIFAADATLPSPFVINLFALDLTTRRLTNLTNAPQAWNEQGTFSPSGKKIAFMSSRNNPEYVPPKIFSLRAEAFLMDADGKNVVQLSHFNTPGFPEYTPGKASIATKAAWSPDGTQLLQTQHFAGLPSVLWMFTFAGACGAE